jgi:hypothetical protein
MTCCLKVIVWGGILENTSVRKTLTSLEVPVSALYKKR